MKPYVTTNVYRTNKVKETKITPGCFMFAITNNKNSLKIFQYVGFIFSLTVVHLSVNASSNTHVDESISARSVKMITEQQAINTVFNRIEKNDNRIVVRNRNHTATFDMYGVNFLPTLGPVWHWQINQSLKQNVTNKVIAPVLSHNKVDYAHEGFIERYLLKKNTIEQRFIIEEPYQDKHDLIIEGVIKSPGKFITTTDGWLWQNQQGVVSLGQVTVFDAKGNILPATMHTEENFSRITVAASTLKTAHYPVTIDPEIGSNDFRITEGAFDTLDSSVSYNSINNQYLVIRVGSFDDGVLATDEYEIYGQLIDAANGAKIGNVIRLSFIGTDGIGELSAYSADITYNETNNEFFIVWSANELVAGLAVNDEVEIYGQRVNAATGTRIGDSIRLSDMGPDGDFTYAAFFPSVVFNKKNNEYFVVWAGDDNSGLLANGEAEIFGQRVNAAGEEMGGDVRYSDMGPDGDIDFEARDPDVSYSEERNEYLIVWVGDDNTPPLVDDEFEVFGQRVNAETGAEIGEDIQLSDMGVPGQTIFLVSNPAVAYNIIDNEFFVVWEGDDATGFLTGEFEIYGQRVDATTGFKIGDDIRLSDMGANGLSGFDAGSPSINYNINNNEYLVVWHGDDDTSTLVNNEFEIYSQRVNSSNGNEIGLDTRLSDMGTDGDINFFAAYPVSSFNANSNQYFVIWRGDDNVFPSVDDDIQLFGQILSGPATVFFANASQQITEDIGSAVIEVQRIGDTSNTITVQFETVDGTATAPSDYTAANGTLTFNPGEISKTFTVLIVGDKDGDRSINLKLNNVSIEGDIDSNRSTSLLVITDDDKSSSKGGGGAFNLLTLFMLVLIVMGRQYIRR